jgi:exopolysaccharide biosynthesis polyprenyl glycosylphosphotransferase
MASIIRPVPGEPELTESAYTEARATLALTDEVKADDIQVVADSGSLVAGPGALAGTDPAGPCSPAPMSGGALRRHLTVGDVIALSGAWGTLLAFRDGVSLGRQAVYCTVAVVATLVAMHRAGLYRSRVCALRSLEFVRALASAIIGTAAFVGCQALAGHVSLAGPLLAGAGATAAVLVLRWRFTRWLKARRSVSKFLRTVVLVGTDEDAEALWVLLSEEPELGYRVGAVVGQDRAGAPWSSVAHTAELEEMGPLAARAGASGVIVVASALSASERLRAVNIAQAAGLHVQVWPGLYGLSSRRTRMVPISGIPLLYVEPKRARKWELAVKRAMDLVLATVLGLAFAPVMALAALAIKRFDGGGAVIHRSQRVGRDGVTIEVLKLRTMVPGASQMMVNVEELNERKGGPLFKAANDPRVTKVGRILRATSIDELPQLWNVLNGTMSMVGPRPALLHEVEHFDDELRRRHEMRPGITGLWQVEARDNPSFSAYRRHDLSYVDDWSLGLDVAILASTAHELTVRGFKALAQLAGRPAKASATSGELAAGSSGKLAGGQAG